MGMGMGTEGTSAVPCCRSSVPIATMAPTRLTRRWRPAPTASAPSRSAWWRYSAPEWLQAIVVALTGSVALLADTIHNFSDALTALPLWIAFVLGRRAATRRYTYGYGRAEDLASVFIVAMPANMSRSAASFIPNRSPKSASSSPPERPSSPAAMLRSIADPAMLRDTDPARHLPRPTRDGESGPSRSRARRRSCCPSSRSFLSIASKSASTADAAFPASNRAAARLGGDDRPDPSRTRLGGTGSHAFDNALTAAA